MDIEDKLLTLGFCLFFLLVLSLVIPVRTSKVLLVDRVWYATTTLLQDYETRECNTDSEGKVKCETVERTRTLASDTNTGKFRDDISFPPYFETVPSDAYNERNLSFEFVFRRDNGVLYSYRTTEQGFYSTPLEHYCKSWDNIWGSSVLTNC